MDKPVAMLTIGGVPSDLFLGSGLSSLTYHDVHHGEVDDLTFDMADPAGLFRGAWAIDEGTIVTAVIGYSGKVMMPVGSYEVDETEAAGGAEGDKATFRALAAFTSKELRTERSEAYDQMTLKDIVGKVAARHGLRVTGTIPTLKFERITQDKTSDLQFLTRLADDWGFYFSVKGDQLVFVAREEVESAPPAGVYDLIEGVAPKSFNLRKSTKGLYKKATVKYLHPRTKKLVEAVKEDPRVVSGDTLKITERAESQAHAERMVAARLAKANQDLGTGELEIVGNALMVAGQVVQLGPGFGKYAGRWLVTSADHNFSAEGYSTSLNIRAL